MSSAFLNLDLKQPTYQRNAAIDSKPEIKNNAQDDDAGDFDRDDEDDEENVNIEEEDNKDEGSKKGQLQVNINVTKTKPKTNNFEDTK